MMDEEVDHEHIHSEMTMTEGIPYSHKSAIVSLTTTTMTSFDDDPEEL